MKNHKKAIFYKNTKHCLSKEPKCWGVTSVEERGQIVIPAEARKALGLKQGEKLLVFSRGKKFLGILKADELSGHLKNILSKIEGK